MRVLLFLLVLASSAWAGDVKEVPVGELRSELFAMARETVTEVTGKEGVKFKGSMKQSGDWAFFYGQIVDDAGKPVTVGPAESAETAALWKKGQDGWEVMKIEVGFTDVVYLGWAKEYGAPADLF